MVERVDRIFAAAPLPDEVRLALVDRLGGLQIPGKLVPPENWHITLKFLGNIPEVTYERFLAALDEADLAAGFRVAVGGLGAFPKPRKAAVVWLGIVRGEDRLLELADSCDRAALGAGLDADDRPFRPHLTLSRVRPEVDVSRLVEGTPPLEIDWRCESIVVYRSHLGRGGARYEPLETLPLSR